MQRREISEALKSSVRNEMTGHNLFSRERRWKAGSAETFQRLLILLKKSPELKSDTFFYGFRSTFVLYF